MKDVHASSWCAAIDSAKSEHGKMGMTKLRDSLVDKMRVHYEFMVVEVWS